MMMAIAVLPCLCLCFYAVYLLSRAYYYRRLLANNRGVNEDFPLLSILVAARNEEKNLPQLLKCIAAQDYPAQRMELIIVNDHSEDDTVMIATEAARRDGRISILHLNDRLGKKAAVEAGVKAARGEWIVTTDADCHMGAQWLSKLAQEMNARTGFVSGPVQLTGDGWFAQMQALEFAGLNAVGAASIEAGEPNLCNGANLAYRKELFAAVGGFGGHEHLASGDDEFLMHKISAAGWRIAFAADPLCIVKTAACENLRAFALQRRRWVSKSRHYSRRSLTLILVSAWLAMLSFPLLAAFTVSDARWGWALAAAFALKVLAEAAVLLPATRFFGNFNLLIWLLPEQLLHIAYLLWAGVAGNAGEFEWKGRKTE